MTGKKILYLALGILGLGLGALGVVLPPASGLPVSDAGCLLLWPKL